MATHTRNMVGRASVPPKALERMIARPWPEHGYFKFRRVWYNLAEFNYNENNQTYLLRLHGGYAMVVTVRDDKATISIGKES